MGLTLQVAESQKLDKKLKESVRQNETLQRNLMAVMEKENALHKQ
jgi:hypothetical protein